MHGIGLQQYITVSPRLAVLTVDLTRDTYAYYCRPHKYIMCPVPLTCIDPQMHIIIRPYPCGLMAPSICPIRANNSLNGFVETSNLAEMFSLARVNDTPFGHKGRKSRSYVGAVEISNRRRPNQQSEAINTLQHRRSLTNLNLRALAPEPIRQTRPKPYHFFRWYGSQCKLPYHFSGPRDIYSPCK